MEAATNGISQAPPMQEEQQQQAQSVVVNLSGNRVGLVKEVVSSGGQTIFMERRGPVPVTVYQSASNSTASTPSTSLSATSRPFTATTATNIIVVNSRDSKSSFATTASSSNISSGGGIFVLSKDYSSSSAKPIVGNQTRLFSVSASATTAAPVVLPAAAHAPSNAGTAKPTIIIGGQRAAQFNLAGTRIVSPSTGYLQSQQQQQQQSSQMLQRLRPPSPLKVLQASSQGAAATAGIGNRSSKVQPSYLPPALTSSLSVNVANQQQQPPPLAANEVIIGDAVAADSVHLANSTSSPSQPTQSNLITSRRKQRLLEGHGTVAVPNVSKFTPTTTTSKSSAGSAISVRCICQYTHDDGNCVQCVACHVWQHVDCMMLRTAESESLLSYQCEQCQPKPVNVSRAMRLQTRKLDKLREIRSQAGLAPKASPSLSTKKTAAQAAISSTRQPIAAAKYREAREPVYSDQFNRRFARLMLALYGSANASVPLRQQDDSCASDYREDPTELLLAQRCRVVQPGRLEATLSLSPGDPVIEYRGRVCLPEELPSSSLGSRFVLYYAGFDSNCWTATQTESNSISNLPLVAIDASNLGNDARYVRRSCRPNCSVQHLVLDGRPHLILIANERLRPGDELTLPFDFDYQLRKSPVACACSRPHTCPVRLFFQRLQQHSAAAAVVEQDSQPDDDDVGDEEGDNQSVSSTTSISTANRSSATEASRSSVAGAFDDLIGDIHASASKKRAATGAAFKKPGSGGKSRKANRSISFDTPASTSTKVHNRQNSQPEKKTKKNTSTTAARSISVDQANDAAAAASPTTADAQQQGSSNLDREERWMQAMLKRIETMEKRQRAAKRQRQRSSEQKQSHSASSPSVSVDTEEAKETLAAAADTQSKPEDAAVAATVPKESPKSKKTPTKHSAGSGGQPSRKPKKEEISFDEFVEKSSSHSPADGDEAEQTELSTIATPSKRPKNAGVASSNSSPLKSPQPQQPQSAASTAESASRNPAESREDRLLQMYIKRIEQMERRAGASSSRKRQKSSTGEGGGASSTSPSPKKPRPTADNAQNSQPAQQGKQRDSTNGAGDQADDDNSSLSSSDDDTMNFLDDDLIARERRERREARKSPRHRVFHSPPPQQSKSSMLSSSAMTAASSRSPMKTPTRSAAEEALVSSFAAPAEKPPADEPQCDRIIYTEDCVDPFAKHMRRQASEPASSSIDLQTSSSSIASSAAATATTTSTSAKKRWLSKAIRDYSEEAGVSSSVNNNTNNLSLSPTMPPPPPPPPTQPPALTSPEEMPLKKRLRAVHSCEEASSVPAAESNQVQAQSVVLSPTSSANQFLASSSFVDNQTDLQLSTGDKSTVAMDEKTDSSAPIVDDQPADVSAGQQQPPPQPPSPPPPPPMPSLPPPLPPLPPLPALASPGSLPPPSSLLQSPPLPLPTQPPLLPPPPSQPTSLQLTDEAGEGSDGQPISVGGGQPRTPCSSPPPAVDPAATATTAAYNKAVDNANDSETKVNNSANLTSCDKEEQLYETEVLDEIIDEEDEYYNVDDRDDNSWSANRPKTPDTEPPDDEDQSAAAAEVEAASASSVNAEDTVREILKRDQEIRDMQELAALERRKTKLMYQLRYVERQKKPTRHHSGSGGSGEAASSSTSRRVQVVQPLQQQQQQQQLAKQKQQLPSSSAAAASAAASTTRAKQPPSNLGDLQQMLMNTINKLNEQLHAVVASGSGATASSRSASSGAASSGTANAAVAAASNAPSTSEAEKPTGSGAAQKSTGCQSHSKDFPVRGYSGIGRDETKARPRMPPQ
ncbi:hypothetical protein BOX15_Mlig018902g1 [Macrostomum lignano]|uniref:SET domain-containing protein n=1 Tax=Macrostomum lignano TaxID=282301 RepID=A0A267GCN6_9PLAT|nr:hypothetical protein BOX15_Mlig018902g1 [Macrostomum lignano]